MSQQRVSTLYQLKKPLEHKTNAIQILHVEKNHCAVISIVGCMEAKIKYYDSVYSNSSQVQNRYRIARMFHRVKVSFLKEKTISWDLFPFVHFAPYQTLVRRYRPFCIPGSGRHRQTNQTQVVTSSPANHVTVTWRYE